MSERIFQGTVVNKGTLSRYENGVNTHYPNGSTILLNQAEVDYYVTELGHVDLPMAPVPIAQMKNPGGKFAAEPNQDNHESTQNDESSTDSEVHEGSTDDQSDANSQVGEGSEVDAEVTEQPHWTDDYEFTPGVTKAIIKSGMDIDETADSTLVELKAIPGIGAKAAGRILAALNPVERPRKTEVPEDTSDDLLS